jgi:hypothetical protein
VNKVNYFVKKVAAKVTVLPHECEHMGNKESEPVSSHRVGRISFPPI